MKEINIYDFLCPRQVGNFIEALQSGKVGTQVLEHLRECPECQALAEKAIDKIPFPTGMFIKTFYNKILEG